MNAADKDFIQLGAEAWPGGMRGVVKARWLSRPRRRSMFRWLFALSLAAASCAAVYLIADERSPVHQAGALL